MATFEPGLHYQHNDNPHDGDPVRAGKYCGPQCDLYEPATDAQYDAAIAYATALGTEHGTNAAGWYEMDTFGGRVTRGAEDAARRIIRGIEDGDPAVLDTLPSADLSGEWADSLTGPQLVDDAISAAGIEHDDTAEDVKAGFSDICDAYENAFNAAAEAEILRMARLAAE